MVVGAKVCEHTDGFLWFVCGLYVGISSSPLRKCKFVTGLHTFNRPRSKILVTYSVLDESWICLQVVY